MSDDVVVDIDRVIIFRLLLMQHLSDKLLLWMGKRPDTCDATGVGVLQIESITFVSCREVVWAMRLLEHDFKATNLVMHYFDVDYTDNELACLFHHINKR